MKFNTFRSNPTSPAELQHWLLTKMAYKFDKKFIVITGGAGSIGCAIADNFLQKNVAKVILVDLNEELGNSVAETLKSDHGEQRVEFYNGDVTTDLDDLYKKIIEAHETVDVLVNCAGVGEDRLVENTININATALIKWSLKFHEHMRCDKSGNGGTIINISSVLGYRTLPYAPVYQASKFAVLGFSKSLGHDENFTKFGVRVVTVCPGFTESNLAPTTETLFTDIQSGLRNYLKSVTFQKADVVGKATVDVYETAASGTVWEISRSEPLVLVS